MSHLDFREKVFSDLDNLDNEPKILDVINRIFSTFNHKASVQAAKKPFNAEGRTTTVTVNAGRLMANLRNDKEVYVAANLLTQLRGDNNSDIGLIYEIKGAIVSGGVFTLLTQTAVSAGNAFMTLDTPLARVFSIRNISSTDAIGRHYIIEDDTTFENGAPIEADYDKVHMKAHSYNSEYRNYVTKATFTVPDGYYGIVKNVQGGVFYQWAMVGIYYLQVRKPGLIFTNQSYLIGNRSGELNSELDNYVIVEPNSDIQLVIDGTADGKNIMGGFSGVLAKIID